MQKRKCLLCNEEFLPKSFNQYICTNEHTFICPCCNKEYTPSKDQIRIFVKTQKIGGCSYKCRSSIGLQTKIEKYGKGKYECEVIRGATELGYTIIGGASKIWKYFINNYKYNNCVYYIDYNYFNGNSLSYLDLKFIKTQVSFKNYFVKENKIKNRDPNHHKEILELYKTNEVWQIWNAGTKVYIWSRK